MRKLGIIGGAEPYASALLYQEIIAQIYEKNQEAGRPPFPEIFFISYPFTAGMAREEALENEATLVEELRYCVDKLADHGAEVAVLACNTLHATLQKIDLRGMQLVSLPEALLCSAEEKRINRLLILGTQATQMLGVYRHDKIEAIYPGPEAQAVVDGVIANLHQGIIELDDAHSLSEMISEMGHRGEFDGIALGCTDLPVLHHYHAIHGFGKPIFDSIKTPVPKIIKEIYS